MDDQAVENKLERILWNAQRALEAFDVPDMPDDMRRIEVTRRLNIIIAASQPFATRWLNFIPDPIDQPDPANDADMDRGCREPDPGPDYDAMGLEASMDRTYPDDIQTQGGPCVDDIPTKPTPGCPF